MVPWTQRSNKFEPQQGRPKVPHASLNIYLCNTGRCIFEIDEKNVKYKCVSFVGNLTSIKRMLELELNKTAGDFLQWLKSLSWYFVPLVWLI